MSKLSYIHENRANQLESPEYLPYFGLSRSPFTGNEIDNFNRPAMDPADVVNEVNAAIGRPGLTVVTGKNAEERASIIENTIGRIGDDVSLAWFSRGPAKPHDLLAGILEKFGFDGFEAGLPQYRDVLAAFLAHKSQTNEVTLVVIEQAEKLSETVLDEIVRLMQDKAARASAHILFVGEPEFGRRMQEPLGGLSCKFMELARSEPLSVADYVFERLNAAGLPGRSLFTSPAIDFIESIANGEPGLINGICHHALEAACADGLKKVSKGVLQAVTQGIERSSDLPARPTMAEVRPLDSSGLEQRRHSSLIMTRDGKRISRFELTNDRVIMGRHKSNDIYIPRPGISLFHAVLVTEGKDVFLFDLRSTNGTSINGHEVSKRKLMDGDVIFFGSLSLKFCQGSSGISDQSENSALPGFTETVVLEGSDSSDPTVYLQTSL